MKRLTAWLMLLLVIFSGHVLLNACAPTEGWTMTDPAAGAGFDVDVGSVSGTGAFPGEISSGGIFKIEHGTTVLADGTITWPENWEASADRNGNFPLGGAAATVYLNGVCKVSHAITFN